MDAEYFALVEGVRVATVHSSSRQYCEAYSDAKPLVDKMRGANTNSGKWSDYYVSANWLLDKFDDWSLNYRPREHNEDAHELARMALREGRES